MQFLEAELEQSHRHTSMLQSQLLASDTCSQETQWELGQQRSRAAVADAASKEVHNNCAALRLAMAQLKQEQDSQLQQDHSVKLDLQKSTEHLKILQRKVDHNQYQVQAPHPNI